MPAWWNWGVLFVLDQGVRKCCFNIRAENETEHCEVIDSPIWKTIQSNPLCAHLVEQTCFLDTNSLNVAVDFLDPFGIPIPSFFRRYYDHDVVTQKEAACLKDEPPTVNADISKSGSA